VRPKWGKIGQHHLIWCQLDAVRGSMHAFRRKLFELSDIRISVATM
jgi:hypothetical protein